VHGFLDTSCQTFLIIAYGKPRSMPRNKISPKSAGVERMMSRQRGPIWRLIEDFYGERLVEVDGCALYRRLWRKACNRVCLQRS